MCRQHYRAYVLCLQMTYQPVPVTPQGSQPRPLTASSVQQLSVTGSKFQYVRLVTTSAPTHLTARAAGPPGIVARLFLLL